MIDRPLDRSFLIAPDRVVEDWNATDVDAIDANAVAAILTLDPAVVLIGTGAQQRMLAPQQLAMFLRHGIGVEVMSNAAASRTYNLLAGEGRRVIGAFILPALHARS